MLPVEGILGKFWLILVRESDLCEDHGRCKSEECARSSSPREGVGESVSRQG